MAWLVLHCRAKHEFAAESALGREVPAYCPKQLAQRRPRKMHGLTLVRLLPRFSGYLFARDDVGAVMNVIRRSTAPLGLVRFGDQIARLEDEVVDALRESDFLAPASPQALALTIGDQVMLADGVFAGRVGQVVTLEHGRAGVQFAGSQLRIRARACELIVGEIGAGP